MPEIQCPTPSCGRMLVVKTTERGRPSVSCKVADGGCGFMGFVNAQKGVAMWAGKEAPAIAEKPKAAQSAKGAPAAKEKSSEGGFKFPWQE